MTESIDIDRSVGPEPPEAPCAVRRAGILLPVFSLPGGGFGDGAIRWLDFMEQSGQTVWQILPLGPTMGDGSPYNSNSSNALNPDFLCMDWLAADKGFRADTPPERRRLGDGANPEHIAAFETFLEQEDHWLPDYALFMAIKAVEGQRQWHDWPVGLRDRTPDELARFRRLFHDQIRSIAFEQFLLDRQWRSIVDEAHRRGILIYGDMPIFVALDSADVWANREQFQLDETGAPIAVAGVPPDYFSETGQRWGNPLFDWPAMQADGFAWWQARFARQREMYDWVRIDHFRGLEAYWRIPADSPTALAGEWVEAPGEAMLMALKGQSGGVLPVIAEDLGVITPQVTALRQSFDLPGMLIMQFAFDGSAENPYQPEQHHRDAVVYTGTHDNDTTMGWWQTLDDNARQWVRYILAQQQGIPEDMPMPEALIRSTLESRAGLAIVPFADWLHCDSRCRINVPGTIEGNWHWQVRVTDFSPELADLIRQKTIASGRLPTGD